MRQFKVLRTVKFASGVIGLSAAQAGPRGRALQKTKAPGVYLIAGPVEFKAGEVIALEEAPKAYVPHLEAIKARTGDSG